MRWHIVRPVTLEWLNQDYYALWLEKPAGYSYVPGQFMAVSMMDDEDKRFYSFASHPSEPFIELVIKRVHGGKFSQWLSTMPERIRISDALGKLSPSAKRPAMIANGVGIAPFISLIKHFSMNRPDRAMLIYGEKTAEDFIFKEWFSSFDWLEFTPITSREGKREHVQDYFHRVLEFKPDIVYAVGSLAMSIEAKKFFSSHGIPAMVEGFG